MSLNVSRFGEQRVSSDRTAAGDATVGGGSSARAGGEGGVAGGGDREWPEVLRGRRVAKR